jgi:predicted Fe-Mo cluster-binding NifX family protein
VTELERAHQISQRLEERIKKDIPYVDYILIHYEPIKREYSHIAIPYMAKGNKVSEHFGEASTFLILMVKLKDNSLVRKNILTNPYLLEEKGKGILVAELLVKNGVDRVVLREKFHGKGPEYVFREAGVKVTLTSKTDLQEVMAELKIKAGTH